VIPEYNALMNRLKNEGRSREQPWPKGPNGHLVYCSCPDCNVGGFYPEGESVSCGSCNGQFLAPKSPDQAIVGAIVSAPAEVARAVLSFCLSCGSMEIDRDFREQAICPACATQIERTIVLPAHVETASLARLTIDQIRSFSPLSFEKFLQALFRRMGFEVELTPPQDQGADLLATNVESGQRLAVQAKRYASPVGNSAVQELIAGMVYWKCDQGMLISTADEFTSSAKDLVRQAGKIVLVNASALQRLIDGYLADLHVFVAELDRASEESRLL